MGRGQGEGAGGDRPPGGAHKRACAPGPHVRASLRRRGGELAQRCLRQSQKPRGAMEPAPDPGLGDSSLHRYLDGEFWSLKNELRRLLGGSPLFRHRYCAAAGGRLAVSPRSPRAPGGHRPACSRPGRGITLLPCAGDRLSPPEVRAPQTAADLTGPQGGWPPPAELACKRRVRRDRVKGWARSGRRGAPLRVAAGRFWAASVSQLLECPPLLSHSGWWEKRQKSRDVVCVDRAQGDRASVYATGAPDQVCRNRAGQLRLWVVSAWKRGTFICTGMDWPCTGHIWASGMGRTPRSLVLWF